MSNYKNQNTDSYRPNYSGNNNSRGNYNSPQRPIVKHSGAKHTKYFPKTGPNAGVEQHLTSGWRLSKGELISIRCVTTSKSKLGDKGWFGSVAVTMTNTKTGANSFHWGTMEEKSGKVVIDSMAMVINPKAKNGGYSGTFLNK
ncbi:hypothetical protein [Flavobacterium sp. LB2P53]|uniref:hypothetical protein n=1 Tax=Flavobacterium sp. LB2P53 TaxID=2497481 RepID=UPI000F82A128|nr:hypothetical protein [Flavobacterium sp. LB2P53]RTY69689.1 hypothetical protein EKL95_05885 [Flavobacterium sp. LB2P53]